MNRFLVLILSLFILDSCSSGKAALKKGDYYDAVLESVQRLRESPDHKKARSVLQQGYPMAVQYIDNNVQNQITADAPDKWRNAVKGYQQINYLSDQIKTSPGALKVIPNPTTRYKELADAKGKAAEESYNDGINFLMKNTRDDAKTAYFDFKESNDLVPGFRESIEMMNQAEFVATLRVAYELINNSNYNYTMEPVINSLRRQFLSFKPVTQKDSVPPHQNLRLIFNGYRQDNVASVTSYVENPSKDVKVGEKKGADGKTQDVMQNVTAKVTIYRKTKRGYSNANLTITDASSGATLANQTVDGQSVWQWEWATYSGDQRALTSTHQNLIGRRDMNPNDQDLFNQALNNLSQNLRGNLQGFYSKY